MGDWHQDPTGQFEKRFHDGTDWTEHVFSNGNQSISPMPGANTGVTESYGAVAGMQPSSTVIVWQGYRNNLTAMASAGTVVGAKYRLTEDGLYFEAGILTSKEELIPLWAVTDIDLRQSMTQKARGVGDCIVRLDTGRFNYGQNQVTIESISDAKTVRDLIARYANMRRTEMLNYQQDREVERRKAGAMSISVVNSAGTPAESAGPSLATRLKEIAELRDAGILTEEEFQAQKAKILSES